MTGRAFQVETLGAADGPGIRTVFFLSGCPLRCAYCHNPESWDPSGGEPLEPEAALRIALRARPYYGARGGVTLSGGEPLMQPEFGAELFALLKSEGIHTALDTSGVGGGSARRLLDATDLCLLDVKSTDPGAFSRIAGGGSLSEAEAFLRELSARGIETWIRQVVAVGMNDSDGDADALRALAAGHACVTRIELLPFRKLCAEKYARLGIPFPMAGAAEPSEARLRALRARLGSCADGSPSR